MHWIQNLSDKELLDEMLDLAADVADQEARNRALDIYNPDASKDETKQIEVLREEALRRMSR